MHQFTQQTKFPNMNTDLRDLMSQHTDDELVKIITIDRDDYQSSTLEIAEEEIRKRNIDATIVEQIKSDLLAKIEHQRKSDSMKVSPTTRFIHLVVDSIASIIVVVILGFIFSFLIVPTNRILEVVYGYFMFELGHFVYYVFMETKYQKTIGKFITKTKVVNKDGTKPEAGDILRRTLCRLIPLDRISFLFVSVGIHDKFSDTIVIKDKSE